MGCLCSKTEPLETCSRCYIRKDAHNLALTNFFEGRICKTCIESLQELDYRRRLAALRDESTPSDTVHPSVINRIRASESTVQSLVQPSIYHRSVTRVRVITPAPVKTKALFGEYKCQDCRHTWTSRRSWRGMYQKCQKCGAQVYPHLQREVRKSDMTKTGGHLEHLCEKCTRLGHYCGDDRRGIINRRIL